MRLLNGHSSAAHSIIERAGPVNDAAWGVEKNLLEISPDRLFEGGFAQKVSHPVTCLPFRPRSGRLKLAQRFRTG